MSNPLDQQIGGKHYLDMKIRPFDLSMANKLNAVQHTAIKYIMRYPFKDGRKDLKKAIHCIDWLIEYEYGKDKHVIMWYEQSCGFHLAWVSDSIREGWDIEIIGNTYENKDLLK